MEFFCFIDEITVVSGVYFEFKCSKKLLYQYQLINRLSLTLYWQENNYDCFEIRELYKDFKIKTSKEIAYALGSNLENEHKKVCELYITNY